MNIATIIVYNEEDMLPGCLESVEYWVDRIVVVDGAYAHFPHTVPYSTDATRHIAACYRAEWIPCPADEDGGPLPWPTQVEKRTAYLVGEEGDWYLHIDADERLIGALPELEDGRHYALRVAARSGHLGWAPRIFQHRGHMRYEGSHNGLWSDDRVIRVAEAIKVQPDVCHLAHLAQLRDVGRQRLKGEYYAWQKPAERRYRRTHGI